MLTNPASFPGFDAEETEESSGAPPGARPARRKIGAVAVVSLMGCAPVVIGGGGGTGGHASTTSDRGTTSFAASGSSGAPSSSSSSGGSSSSSGGSSSSSGGGCLCAADEVCDTANRCLTVLAKGQQ